MPDNYANYFVVGTGAPHPTVFGFKTVSNDTDVAPAHNFMLNLGEDDEEEIDEPTRADATAAFAPLRHLASTMFTTFYDRLADNRRWQITRQFDPMVQSFMSSTAMGGDANGDIAQTMVNSLARDNAWSTLVRLSELNRATAAHRIQSEGARQVTMRQIKDDRATAAWSDPTRPVAVGQDIDLDLKYAIIGGGFKHQAFDITRAGLRRGAVAVDDVTAELSYSAAVREAFRIYRETVATGVEAPDAAEDDTSADDRDA